MKFDNINIQELSVILICGIGLGMAIVFGQNDLAMAMGGGLVGYLGGVTTTNKE